MTDDEDDTRRYVYTQPPTEGFGSWIKPSGWIAAKVTEPSDAQVKAAWEAYITAQEADPYDREGRMRAALRAAAEVVDGA